MENKELYKVRKKDAMKAAETFADAFKEDPLFSVLLEEMTDEQRTYFFEVIIKYCIKYGEVYAPSENCEGVIAITYAKYANMTLWRQIRSGAIFPAFKMNPKSLNKYFVAFQKMIDDRIENMEGRDYIYVHTLGVKSDFQGQGIGKILLNEAIVKSEREKLPIYLETETELNVKIYERFGFKMVRKETLPAVDMPLWEFIREVE